MSVKANFIVMNKLNSYPSKIYGFITANYLFSKYIHDNKRALSC